MNVGEFLGLELKTKKECIRCKKFYCCSRFAQVFGKDLCEIFVDTGKNLDFGAVFASLGEKLRKTKIELERRAEAFADEINKELKP